MKKKFKIRHLVQLLFFGLITLVVINHQLVETGDGISFVGDDSLHGICPFGGVVTLYQLFTTGTFVQKIHESAVILMGLVFITSIIAGPVFCSWVCPLGSFQEFLGKIGKKIFKKRYNQFVPKKLDKIMKYFRYFVLIWVLYVTAKSGYLVFKDYDPYYALFNFWTGEVVISAFVVLGFTILLSLLVERPWCKYACPYGALLGITNRFSIFKLRRNKKTCISCHACDLTCPMNIEIMNKEVIHDSSCIRCLECSSDNICPVEDTVTIKIGGYKNEA
ncbi:MAG: 4Fe-4S binding protein [Clostridia bacterium]|nr:4Fe-4S binding protein [Clostridia bacterium]